MLDGAPAEEETQKRLHEDEVKTKLLEQVILRSASESPRMSNQKALQNIVALERSNMRYSCYHEDVGVDTFARAGQFLFFPSAEANLETAGSINPRAEA